MRAYNPYRFQPVSKNDFYDHVAEMKTYVSTFTENYILDFKGIPNLDDFIETHPLYDHEILYPDITAEMQRVSKIVIREMEENRTWADQPE